MAIARSRDSLRWSLLFLVVSGLVLAGCALFIATQGLLPNGYSTHWSRQRHYVWQDYQDTVIAVDVQSGKISRGKSVAYPSDHSILSDGSWYFFDDRVANQVGGTSIAVADYTTGQVLRHVNLGSFNSATLVGGRYIISWDATGLTAYDLTTDQPQPLALTWSSPLAVNSVGPIPEQPRFLVTVATVTSIAQELYEIDSSGIKLKASWPVGVAGYNLERGDSIAVVNQSLTGLERRSLETGELLARYPLPDGFDTTAVDFAFGEHYVSLLDKDEHIRHFHVATGKELVAVRDASLPEVVPGSTWAVFLSRDAANGSAYMVDRETNEVQWSFHFDGSTYCSSEITPDRKVWITSSRFGLTAYQLDFQSGALISKIQPFAWLPWSLAIVSLLSFAWFVRWRRFVMQNSWSVWWEFYLLLIWVLGLMTFRMWVAFNPNDFARIPAAIGYGAILASLQVAVLWMWLGSGRVIDRLFHLAMIYIIIGVSFRTLHTPAPHDSPSTWLMYCMIPMVGMLLAPAVLRWNKNYRAVRNGLAAARRPEVYSLKTLLIATAVVAILVTLYRTILPSLGRAGFGWLSYNYFAGSAAVAVFASAAAFGNRQRLVYRAAALLAVLLMLALLVYVWREATLGPQPSPWYSTVRFRIIALGTTFSFTFWMVSRLGFVSKGARPSM